MEKKAIVLLACGLLLCFSSIFSQPSCAVCCPHEPGTNVYNFQLVTAKEGTVSIDFKVINIDNVDVPSCNISLFVYDQYLNVLNRTEWRCADTLNPGDSANAVLLLYCRQPETLTLSVRSSTCISYSTNFHIINDNPPNVGDVEPNENFAKASSIGAAQTVFGTVGYGDDAVDNFKTLTPKEGTVRVVFKATNTGNKADIVAGAHLYIYDKKQPNNFLTSLGANTIPAGQTITDIQYIYCRAPDTLFFTASPSNGCVRYEFQYDIINNNPSNTLDVEPNESFEHANPIAYLDNVKGTMGYGDDGVDYFKTFTPKEGTVRVIFKATNTGYSSGGAHLYVYDKNQPNNFLANLGANTIAVGQIITDTQYIYCRAPDTLFFAASPSNGCVRYELQYDIISENPPNIIDTGRNENPDEANPVEYMNLVRGTMGYGGDGADYYKTSTSKEGTVRVIFRATNTGYSDGSAKLLVYDSNQPPTLLLALGANVIAAGQSITDTQYIYCRSAETLYFVANRSSSCFRYEFYYDIINNNPPNVIDTGRNENLDEANHVSHMNLVKGTVGYGGDGADYYKTSTPKKGSVRVIFKATNTGYSSGGVKLLVYDSNQPPTLLLALGANVIAAGQTITDTQYIYCRSAETLYFVANRSSSCFRYEFYYNVISFSDTALNIVCNTDKKDLTVLYDTTGYMVQWHTADPKNVGAGSYKLMFSRINGCMDSAKVTVAQKVSLWTGNTNSNWHIAANWSTGLVPDAETHVIIPPSAPPCLISAGNAFAASVQARTNGSLTIATGLKLTISANCPFLPD